MTENASFSTKVRRMWGLSLDSWNNILLSFLAVAAVGAAIVAVATYATIRLATEESAAAKLELDAYKVTVDGKVADASKAGIEAGKMAGDALVKAAVLEKEAQELKAANLALELRLQPRRLNGDDSGKLSAALSKTPPLPIAIVSRLFDIEGADFADDLSRAFENAHWQEVRQRDWLMPNKGVAIATLEGTLLPSELANSILDALKTVDIDATITIIKETEQNTTGAHFQPHGLYLLVGAKP